MENEDDSWKELCRVNEIFEKYGQSEMFNKFILTESILVKKCYSCTFIFSSKKIWLLLLIKKSS